VDLARVCAVFELEKACYELRYELDNRPDWAPIPADGILHLLESARS
jgi:predicted trehalose synthase